MEIYLIDYLLSDSLVLRIKKEKDMRDVARPSSLIFLFHPRKLNGTTKYQKDREAD